MRDLFRNSERLAQIQERDPSLYELELRLWKARSRAQLLGARLQMADDALLREQLRMTLADEYDLRVQLLRRERDRLAARIQGLDEQLERLVSHRGESIQRQFDLTTRSARKAGKVGGAGGAGKKQRNSRVSPPASEQKTFE